jgi:hypothetical protein
MPQSTKSLGIAELIRRIKQDLLTPESPNEPDLFSIDEVTLEVNFTVSGDINSGFDLGVVTLGSDVSEERVQKVVIKMTPLVSKQQLIDAINQDPQKAKATVAISAESLTRGTSMPTRGSERGSAVSRAHSSCIDGCHPLDCAL